MAKNKLKVAGFDSLRTEMEENFKKTNISDYESDFDYTELEENDIDDLIGYEKLLKETQDTFSESILEMGRLLKEAQEKLSAYKTGLFMSWYQNLDFNKDQVSFLLKRYNLYLNYQGKKELIANLPVTMIKEITKKDIPEPLLEKVLNGEIKSNKELKKAKDHYSNNSNNSPEFIEEAEIVEENFELYHLKDLIINKVGYILGEEKSFELAEYLKKELSL